MDSLPTRIIAPLETKPISDRLVYLPTYSMLRLLLTVVLIPLTAPVHAEAWSAGSDLLSACEDASPFTQIECMSYIKGALDTSESYEEIKKSFFANCHPRVTMAQVQTMVTKYLQDHPKRLHESASKLVADAMTNAFPSEGGFDDAGELIDCRNRTKNRYDPLPVEKAPAQPTSKSPAPPIHEGPVNWRFLQKDMTEAEVRVLLGEPDKIDIQSRSNRTPRAYWHYSLDSWQSRIIFRQGRVSRLRDRQKIWVVHSWDEPS